MKIALLVVALVASYVVVLTEAAVPYFDDDQGYPASDDDYSENSIDRFVQPAQKRACIRRGGNCDHRANDCCYNSSCRCNLWGSNCRCQRMGLAAFLLRVLPATPLVDLGMSNLIFMF